LGVPRWTTNVAAYDRVGKDGPRVNPFALEPTETNIIFLYSFVKLFLTNGGAELEPEDEDAIHKAVQDIYLLDAANRRLSNLFLPKKLDSHSTAANQQRNNNQIVYTKEWTLPRREPAVRSLRRLPKLSQLPLDLRKLPTYSFVLRGSHRI
jgi:hypothetical protein